jgi:GDP-L-fucose synthase
MQKHYNPEHYKPEHYKPEQNKTNDQYIFVSSKDYDLTSMDQVIQMFSKIKPHYVIHLAACVGGLFKNMNNKVEMLEKNLMINHNVVKCCHDFKIEKLVACLSTCIFPDKTEYPINEEMLHSGPPHFSNDAYAYAKRMLEIQCRMYREQYNDNFVCVIPTNIYGPNDNFNLEDAHVLPALIHKCYLSKLNNEDFVVRGSGRPLRQFIYSDDLAKLILWVLTYYNDNDPIILSVSEDAEISIENIARLVAKSFDYEHRIAFDQSFADGQYKKTADNSKLTTLIGDNFGFVDIETGIEETVKWFLKNYELSRK